MANHCIFHFLTELHISLERFRRPCFVSVPRFCHSAVVDRFLTRLSSSIIVIIIFTTRQWQETPCLCVIFMTQLHICLERFGNLSIVSVPRFCRVTVINRQLKTMRLLTHLSSSTSLPLQTHQHYTLLIQHYDLMMTELMHCDQLYRNFFN